MAFELKSTIPWGRNLDEYKSMFNLSDDDLEKRIISFGDGPASFNCEMTRRRKSVVSIDPIYRFSTDELRQRIIEAKDVVLEQMRNNLENYVWTTIKDVDELQTIRMSAMNDFLIDFEPGKAEGRYINHEMPDKTNFGDQAFDLGISSHFLILYSQLGLDFHISSINEMLRVANEIRIFPLLNLDAKKSSLLDQLVEEYRTHYLVTIENVGYEFQKNGNEMLTIKKS